jgi:hypothetical protein
MYFSNNHATELLFSRGLWVTLIIFVLLGVWKVVDIIVWVYNHISISFI